MTKKAVIVSAIIALILSGVLAIIVGAQTEPPPESSIETIIDRW